MTVLGKRKIDETVSELKSLEQPTAKLANISISAQKTLEEPTAMQSTISLSSKTSPEQPTAKHESPSPSMIITELPSTPTVITTVEGAAVVNTKDKGTESVGIRDEGTVGCNVTPPGKDTSQKETFSPRFKEYQVPKENHFDNIQDIQASPQNMSFIGVQVLLNIKFSTLFILFLDQIPQRQDKFR